MTQGTPNTQNQNQNQNHNLNQNQDHPQNQHPHEGQAAEQTKPARPRRAPRQPARARSSAASANRAAPVAEAALAPAPQQAPVEHTSQQTQPASAAQQTRPRRARRPSQQPAAQAVPAAEGAAHAPAPQVQGPEHSLPSSPAANVSAGAAVESAEAPAAQQAAQPKKRATRGGRGHRGGRKGEVQLVKPAEPATEPPATPIAEPVAAAPEAQVAAERGAETEPRIVPVVTGNAPASAPQEGGAESGERAAAAPAATAAAASPSSRFRFGRRGAAAEPEAVAPTPAPGREPEPLVALVAPAGEHEPPAQPSAETPEAEEPWQATVAEIAAESLPGAATASAASAVDDLVAALGLQGASTHGHAEAPTAAREDIAAAEVRHAEAEASAEAEAEEDHQGTRRRRRRRGGKSASAAAAADETAVEPLSAPEWAAERDLRNGYERGTELSQPYSPYNRAPRERLAPVAEPQRPEDSPFGSPEPQMARGFGPQPRGVAGPAPSPVQRPLRERERLEAPPISPNQLGNVLTHAIQQQTDRLLGELRRQPQGPAMTFAVPLPSTERVGIFVDVANLHYSARNQHITLDFGRLLDFLRGNRRLIRAHAYAPTNPEPGAEQSFLNAVRGLGYRITTKNFKTFASGAKKADMDLDLCMDIVRMVDAGALDTVVLVSGDSDFLPLLEYASDRGVRVEVAAFEDAAAMILRQSCDLFINLSQVEGLQK